MQTTARSHQYGKALTVLTSLFFMWGLITSLNDILIPHLKAIFSLTYLQAALIQFCFFTAYFVVSFPAGFIIRKIGYKRGIVLGLVTAGLGCLLFYPAAGAQSYPFFLSALFILAGGITILQVAANPYVTVLGRPETASSRLNLTQAFNSLGATLGPLLGAITILAVAAPAAGAQASAAAQAAAVQTPYLVLAGLLFLLALIIGLVRLPVIKEVEGADEATRAKEQRIHGKKSVWEFRHLVLGAIGIFAYVGAEVGIGSFMVSLMGQPQIAGLSPESAGKYLAIYWGAAMVGRFIGSALMTKINPARILTANALINAVLIGIAILVGGKTAMWSLIAVGLFNSIMFPTIFSLSLKGLGSFTSEGSGILCMAIVGGAIVPVLQAAMADHMGILASFAVPLVCYLYIVHFGARGHRELIGQEKPADRRSPVAQGV
ncbi:sugar MFS transporter [Silvimonas amylolytica]|uniref:Glucose/galactose MFS transporter n=1 Tax=Silvimonas amylolytica TaxID=449663 RepID=A0ABQ2PMQ2_9NEIS|nr:sugar MFS transporter [Silvimonas amylolytica]GGP26650.1 glucose/galactose MFS transporter [Silvimonas amylolytica]